MSDRSVQSLVLHNACVTTQGHAKVDGRTTVTSKISVQALSSTSASRLQVEGGSIPQRPPKANHGARLSFLSPGYPVNTLVLEAVVKALKHVVRVGVPIGNTGAMSR